MQSTIVDLAKMGVIGASLAFILLSYNLLAAERALKDREGNPIPPRSELLKSITQFRTAALVFLIVGVFSEFFLSHGVEIAGAATELAFGDKLVRVRFSEWEFSPNEKLIGFAFDENRINPQLYVLPTLKDQYDVYVGVREKSAVPFSRGDYNLVFGPYKLANQPRVNQTLTADDLALLNSRCVEFAVFGIAKVAGKAVDVKQPFNASKVDYPVHLFNTAGVCP